MKVDTICSRMGYSATHETEKSQEEPGSIYVDYMKLKNEFECEKKLRQKMADKAAALEKQLGSEKKRVEELKFIRENDNLEIIRLEKLLHNKTNNINVRIQRAHHFYRYCKRKR